MLNRCDFIGHVGKDPEIRSAQSGDKCANFSIAVTEKWKNKSGQKQESTEWVRCTAWGALAGVIETYVKKGSKVYVSGKMKTRKWADNSGVEKYSTEINVNQLEMLGDGKQEREQTQHNTAKQDGYAPPQDDLDEIPFALLLPFLMAGLLCIGIA
jgi:single-strand DNA-binding protein